MMLALKDKINRILGNNVRLLLPSYWWKRLFGLVIDRIDEKLDATNIKTINGESVIGEGNLKVGITTVGSIDELNALAAGVGDVATVGEESIMLVSAGDLPQVDDPNELLEKWDNLTRIVKVEFGEPVTENGRKAIVCLNGKKPYAHDTILIWSSEGEFTCGYASAYGTIDITIEQVNKKLQESDYRLMQCRTTDFTDRAFKLYAYSASANAYIKGDSWERLAKESDLEGIEDVNEKIEDAVGAVVFYVDTNGGQLDDEYIAANAEQYKRLRKSDGMLANRPVYVKNYDGFLTAQMVVIDAYKKVGLIFETHEGRRLSVVIFPNGTYSDIADASSSSGAEIRELYIGDSLTGEQKAWNLETKQLVEQNKCITVHVLTEPIDILPAGTIIPQSLYKDGLFFYMATAGINQAIVNIDIDSNGNGLIAKEVRVPDSELSDTSTNAVQNKAVKAYIDNAIINTLNTEI